MLSVPGTIFTVHTGESRYPEILSTAENGVNADCLDDLGRQIFETFILR